MKINHRWILIVKFVSWHAWVNTWFVKFSHFRFSNSEFIKTRNTWKSSPMTVQITVKIFDDRILPIHAVKPSFGFLTPICLAHKQPFCSLQCQYRDQPANRHHRRVPLNCRRLNQSHLHHPFSPPKNPSLLDAVCCAILPELSVCVLYGPSAWRVAEAVAENPTLVLMRTYCSPASPLSLSPMGLTLLRVNYVN